MFGNNVFTRVKRSENKKMAEIAHFLKENDLSVDTTVEVFITVSRDDRLIACGGIAGNIIKCVAIRRSSRLTVINTSSDLRISTRRRLSVNASDGID